MPEGIGLALRRSRRYASRLRTEQPVDLPTRRVVDVEFLGDHVVVARQYDRLGPSNQYRSPYRKPLEPAELGVELRTGSWVPVGQVRAPDSHAADRSFQVPTVRIITHPRARPVSTGHPARDKTATPLHAVCPCQNRVIPHFSECTGGKLLLCGLEFLETRHVGPGLREPAKAGAGSRAS